MLSCRAPARPVKARKRKLLDGTRLLARARAARTRSFCRRTGPSSWWKKAAYLSRSVSSAKSSRLLSCSSCSTRAGIGGSCVDGRGPCGLLATPAAAAAAAAAPPPPPTPSWATLLPREGSTLYPASSSSSSSAATAGTRVRPQRARARRARRQRQRRRRQQQQQRQQRQQQQLPLRRPGHEAAKQAGRYRARGCRCRRWRRRCRARPARGCSARPTRAAACTPRAPSAPPTGAAPAGSA
eukprot:scaffold2973_cov325-Prasinococcus_capsulatus_cf.AAC.8